MPFRRSPLILVVMASVACGRVGFDPLDGAVVPPDGTTGLDGAGLDGSSADADASGDGSVPVDGVVPDGGGTVGTWAHGFTGPGFEFGGPVAVDDVGNTYSSIIGRDTIDLGGMPLTFQLSDVFVASYAPSGAFRWSAVLGGSGWDQASSLFFDAPRGRLVVAGYFSDTVDFGDGTPRTSLGLRDAVVLTLDPSSGGSPTVRTFGGPGTQEVYGVAVASDGATALAGTFERSVDFGGGPLTSNGMFDGFVAALDPAGVHLFSRSFGSNMADRATAVAIDDARNVYVAGYFLRDIDLGAGLKPSAGGEDGFVASYTASGMHRWSYVFGGAGNDRASAIAVAPDGTCFLTGNLESADSGGIPLPFTGSAGFVASFSEAGAYRWSLDVGYGAYVAWDRGQDDIQVASSFSGSIDVGGGMLTSNGANDLLLVELGRDGTHVRSRGFGGPGNESASGVAVNPSGTIALSGSLTGTWTFAGTTMVGDMYGDPFLIVVPR